MGHGRRNGSERGLLRRRGISARFDSGRKACSVYSPRRHERERSRACGIYVPRGYPKISLRAERRGSRNARKSHHSPRRKREARSIMDNTDFSLKSNKLSCLLSAACTLSPSGFFYSKYPFLNILPSISDPSSRQIGIDFLREV